MKQPTEIEHNDILKMKEPEQFEDKPCEWPIPKTCNACIAACKVCYYPIAFINHGHHKNIIENPSPHDWEYSAYDTENKKYFAISYSVKTLFRKIKIKTENFEDPFGTLVQCPNCLSRLDLHWNRLDNERFPRETKIIKNYINLGAFKSTDDHIIFLDGRRIVSGRPKALHQVYLKLNGDEIPYFAGIEEFGDSDNDDESQNDEEAEDLEFQASDNKSGIEEPENDRSVYESSDEEHSEYEYSENECADLNLLI